MSVVADRVVVGDGEKVEAAASRERRQLDDLQATVGVHGVAVEVAGQPLVAGGGRQVAAWADAPDAAGAAADLAATGGCGWRSTSTVTSTPAGATRCRPRTTCHGPAIGPGR